MKHSILDMIFHQLAYIKSFEIYHFYATTVFFIGFKNTDQKTLNVQTDGIVILM